jgi:outer membrane protein assembly factor BamB
MTSPLRNRLLAALLVLVSAPAAIGDDWPNWRGPQRTGISAEAGWLDAWPAGGPPLLWKGEVGTGFSSMAVAGGRVFTIGNANDTDTVFCFDAEKGGVLWKHAYSSELGDKYFEGGPTSTPTVDGDRVFTIGRWGELFCFEAATGRVLWSVNLQKGAGFPVPSWGFGGSPLVLENLLVLNVGDAGAALEKSSGKIIWKSASLECGYSTPLPLRRGDETLLLLGSAKSYLAVEAKTGREAWRVKWITQYGVNAADPVVDGDSIFVSTGYGKGGALLRLGKSEPEIAWQGKVLRTQMNPAVLIGGHLYGVDGDTTEKTALKCVEFATGKEKWARPLAGAGAVAAADGRLIVLGGTGELMVAPASPGSFAPTARANVLTGKCWTVPVLANGRIYCRSADGQVVCVDVRKK